MARVHHKRANKDYTDQGITKGDMYFTWTTRPSGRGKGILHRSLTRPTRASMTSSEFLAWVYTVEDERMGEFTGMSTEEAQSLRDDLASEARDLASEQEDKLNNMPESLQNAPTGEMLRERQEALEAFADELENVQFPDEVEEPEDAPEEPEEPVREDFTNEDDYAVAVEVWTKDHDEWDTAYAEWTEAAENYENFVAELEAAIEEAQMVSIAC